MDYKTTSRMRVCLKTGMLQNCHQTMWKTHFLNQIEIIQNLRCHAAVPCQTERPSLSSYDRFTIKHIRFAPSQTSQTMAL